MMYVNIRSINVKYKVFLTDTKMSKGREELSSFPKQKNRKKITSESLRSHQEAMDCIKEQKVTPNTRNEKQLMLGHF